MSGENNGKVLTVSRKLVKILTDSVKAITPLRPSRIVWQTVGKIANEIFGVKGLIANR